MSPRALAWLSIGCLLGAGGCGESARTTSTSPTAGTPANRKADARPAPRRALAAKEPPRRSPGARSPQRRQAISLNTKGLGLFAKKQYAQALPSFRQAVKADPGYPAAHWNLARTLGALRKLNKICVHDAYLKDILDHLEKAFQLEPAFKRKLRTDSSIEPVRATLRYQRWMGHDPVNATSVAPLLQAIHWYNPGRGMYGPTAKLQFRPGGTFELQILNVQAATPRWQRFSGTYRVQGRTVTLQLRRLVNQRQRFQGTLTPQGILQIPHLDRFDDDPSDCSA